MEYSKGGENIQISMELVKQIFNVSNSSTVLYQRLHNLVTEIQNNNSRLNDFIEKRYKLNWIL